MKLADIAAAVDGRLVGDGDIEILRPVPPHKVGDATDLPLIFSPKALDIACDSPAVAALVANGITVPDGGFSGMIEVDDPRAALAPLSALFAQPLALEPGVHPMAIVDDSAELANDVAVGPYACIGAGVKIGAGTRIFGQATIDAGASIGAACVIHAGARICHDVQIGDRVILHPNACIGADGFSYATPEPPQTASIVRQREVEPFLTYIRRIESLGTVVLEDDVEVGASTCIDRATVGETRIGRNTKIDDQVMIGHNCMIGEDCLLAGQVGLSGSVTLGDRVVMGGRVVVADHITIGDDATFGLNTVVLRNVPERAMMIGYPAAPTADFFNRLKHTHVSRLTRAAEKLSDLARRVARLEEKEENKDQGD